MPDLLSRTFWLRFLAAIGAGTGAIVGTAQAWPFIEPFVPAHRGWVLVLVGDNDVKINDLLRYQAEDKRDKIIAERSGWTIQRQKETDPATQNLMQDRINALDLEMQRIDDRLKRLTPSPSPSPSPTK